MHFAAKDKKLHCFPKKPSLKTKMNDDPKLWEGKKTQLKESEVKN